MDDLDQLRADDQQEARTGAATDVAPVAADATASKEIGPLRKRGKFDRGIFIASLAIAIGVVLIVWGFTVAVTGDDGVDRPEAIESVQPVENAIQVLQQERVVVDLQSGYEARLVIDGIELPTETIGQSDVDPSAQPAPGQQVDPSAQPQPGQQVDLPTTAIFDPGSAVISFQPAEGALIESFEQGIHEARVIYWKIEDGPDKALSYRWTFDVV